jgi:hypothetical protein
LGRNHVNSSVRYFRSPNSSLDRSEITEITIFEVTANVQRILQNNFRCLISCRLEIYREIAETSSLHLFQSPDWTTINQKITSAAAIFVIAHGFTWDKRNTVKELIQSQDKYCIIHPNLVDKEKIFLLPLYVELGLMKQFTCVFGSLQQTNLSDET